MAGFLGEPYLNGCNTVTVPYIGDPYDTTITKGGKNMVTVTDMLNDKLDDTTKILVKADIIDTTGRLSSNGQKVVLQWLFEQHKADITSIVTKLNENKKKEEK